MKKLLFLIGLLFISAALLTTADCYVIPAAVGDEGSVTGYFYEKSYADQDSGFQHLEAAFKFGIKWVPIRNIELYCSPSLRYHFWLYSCTGLGDLDVGATYIFRKGIGAHTFLRLPTGNSNIPGYTEAVGYPKFSSKKVGNGLLFILSYDLAQGVGLHLNTGYLLNIGDLVSREDTINPNPIYKNHMPIGIGVTLPYGVFIEVVTDLLQYTTRIPITKNPKRVVLGVKSEWIHGIKLLGAFEYGTWGTGDPPIHPWERGLHGGGQWDVTLGISFPITTAKKPAKRERVIITKRPVTQPYTTLTTGVLEGRILNRETGKPIKELSFPRLQIYTKTSSEYDLLYYSQSSSPEWGEYKLIFPTGKHLITLEIPGYEPCAKEVTIYSGKSTRIDWELIPIK
ncbi:MAG: PEGA domain-containing protein [bacterium]|nr:PEGA domain-containing protein [bacterium]